MVLSACYGLALGARHGVAAMMRGAAGVPLGFVAVGALAAPAFYIAAAHAGLAMSARALGAQLATALALSGLVLCGLAPALALVSVSTDTAFGAAIFAAAGLGLAGALGVRRMLRSMWGGFDRSGARAALIAFAAFAALLSARVWWLVLPAEVP